MKIPQMPANIFVRCLEFGKTRPCLFFCGSDTEDITGGYVVKLKASVEGNETGLAFELIASQLADLLGLLTPEPAIIKIDAVFGEMIEDVELASRIGASSGLNFGSKFMAGGFSTWPVGMGIPTTLVQSAMEIFAFDAMIQNPDRRADKPNILWKGEDLYVIDHEVGFSFVYDIFPSPTPWKIEGLAFLRKHLFYQGLQRKTVNLDRFAGAMQLLSEDNLNNVFSNIPGEWVNDKIPAVAQHIKEVVNHSNEFIDEIRRFLL
jgi:hypothetical protein